MKISLSEHYTYKKILRFTLPSVIMMIFTSVYGMVDGLFVSNIVGKIPFAAINFVMPYIMILGGLGFMIGAGGSALVACELGKGCKEEASRHFSLLVVFSVIVGVVVTVISFLTVEDICIKMGVSSEMLSDCVIYAKTVMSFCVFFMLQNLFQSFLIANEKANVGLYINIASGVTNAILDYYFIAVLKMGLVGAGAATGIGQVLGGIIPVFFFLKTDCKIRLVKPKFEIKPLIKTCINGSSELLNNISSSLVGMVYNYMLITLLGSNGVSAFGVLMYVQFVFLAAFIGYTIGVAPIISYHYGADNHNELKNILKKSFVITVLAGMLMTAVGIVFSSFFVKIFVGYDLELYNMTVRAFVVFAISFMFSGFGIFASGFFTALNNGLISAAISILRTLVFQMVSIILIPELFGANAIWWSIPIAEFLACLVSLFFIYIKRKEYHYLD